MAEWAHVLCIGWVQNSCSRLTVWAAQHVSRQEHTGTTPTCLSVSVADSVPAARDTNTSDWSITCSNYWNLETPLFKTPTPSFRWAMDKWFGLILIKTGYSFHSVIKDLKPNNKWHFCPFRTLVINSRQTRFVITFQERACSFRLSKHGNTSCYNSYSIVKRTTQE